MHTIEIPKKKIIREIPSQISEMTQDQYIHFVELILDYMDGKFGLDLFRVKLIKNLLDVKVNIRFFLLSEEEQENINGEIFRLSQLCDSFFTDEIRDGKPTKVANLSFIKNLIPEIWGRFYGPEDGLADITFCEYRHANTHFRGFLKSKSDDDLNRLIAVLYRPLKPLLVFRRLMPGFDGRHRMVFTSKYNPVKFEKRVREISRIPYPIRYGIFLWYAGCEDYLVHGKPEIDGHEIDLEILYKSTERSEPKEAGIGLVGILYTLSESNVFGPIEQTDQQNLYDVLARLYQVVQQQREMDEKFEKMRKDGSD